MYKRSLQIGIYSNKAQIQNTLARIEPLPNFSHHIKIIQTEKEIDSDALSILIIDENIEKYFSKSIIFNKKIVIVACIDEKNIHYFSQQNIFLDYIWIKPLSDEKIQLLFQKIQRDFQKKEELSLTKKYLDTLIDSIPDLIWFKDARGAHLKVNNSFCSAVGKSKEDIQGRGHYYIWDLEPDEYAKGEYVCLETELTVLREKKSFLFDETVKFKDEMRKLKTYKSPIFGDNEEVIGTVGLARDVTDLQNLQVEMNILLESLPFAVIATDKNNNITSANQKALRLISLEKKDVLGKDFDFFMETSLYDSIKDTWTFKKINDQILIFSREKILKLHRERLLDVFGDFSGYLFLFIDITLDYRHKDKLEEEANTDYLTGLNNRRRLHDFLRKTPCEKGTSIFLADLDNFKHINDAYGHDAGDKILIAFARLLLNIFPAESLFRLGGDEFAVILINAQDSATALRQEAQLLAKQVIEYFDRDIVHAFYYKEISVSIGIAIDTDNTANFGSLFKKADIALYDSKCSGKSTYTFWEKGL